MAAQGGNHSFGQSEIDVIRKAWRSRAPGRSPRRPCRASPTPPPRAPPCIPPHSAPLSASPAIFSPEIPSSHARMAPGPPPLAPHVAPTIASVCHPTRHLTILLYLHLLSSVVFVLFPPFIDACSGYTVFGSIRIFVQLHQSFLHNSDGHMCIVVSWRNSCVDRVCIGRVAGLQLEPIGHRRQVDRACEKPHEYE